MEVNKELLKKFDKKKYIFIFRIFLIA